MAWQLTRSLAALRDEIKRHLPGVTIYTIGDTAHQQRPSDHNPDDTSGSRATQSDSDSLQEVRAIDIMLNVSTLSMKIVNALVDPRSRPRLKYVIHGGKIWSATNNWVVKPFDGDPHNDHIHVSGRAGDDANAAGWPAVAEIWEDEVEAADINAIATATVGKMGNIFNRVEATTSLRPSYANGSATETNVLAATLARLEAKVDTLQSKLSNVDAEADQAREAELQRDANLAAAVAQVDSRLVQLSSGDLTAAQKAELLRAVLGDDAAAVGALLAQG